MKSFCMIGILLGVSFFALGEDDRFKDLDKYVKPADRVLSAEEATKLAELTVKALGDPGLGERMRACGELGIVISHKAAIPILVAVASNQKEYNYVRSYAIQALANIPDKEVILHLLRIAESAIKEKNRVYASAFYVLHRLLGSSGIDIKEKPPKEILELWKEARGNPEKELAFYRTLWEWQKDKPIDMRKRVYVLRTRSWH